jgi:mannose-6-phosphate isomerase
MINPLPYDDLTAVNKLNECDDLGSRIITDNDNIAKFIKEELSDLKTSIVVIDGYLGADFLGFISTLKKTINANFVDITSFYKSEEEINNLVKSSLPQNLTEDPAQMFGKLFQGHFVDFFDQKRLNEFLETIENNQDLVVCYGYGSSVEKIRQHASCIIYLDVTPKEAALRLSLSDYVNIGSNIKISLEETARRYYFVDAEITHQLRRELHQQHAIDYYVLSNKSNEFQLILYDDLKSVFSELVKRPFRAKPIYIEGVWGGEYIKKIRNLHDKIENKIAWVFEFIPLEASIAVVIAGKYLDIPFYTFLNVKTDEILGKSVNQHFNGYFPVRFNYDDTWHSNGNMSIQVHPNDEYAKKHYNEFGGQHEAYYIVTTGHDAKTYCGFKQNGEDFFDLCLQSEVEGNEIRYQDYIYALESKPGMQVMLPAGTVHASGRNQLVLELGTLTIGAYTYKIYDYIRKDINGKLRPIHTYNAQKVLDFSRDQAWVSQHACIKPQLISENDQYQEWLVGHNQDMYFETFRINLNTHCQYSQTNDDEFTVITVVDGEMVDISSYEQPEYHYQANYLDVVTIPASIKSYTITAKGYQPVVIHKTRLKK